VVGSFPGKMGRIQETCLGRDQPVLLPETVYEQAPNTWNEPGAGSVSVPVNAPAEVIVPRISIAAEDPGDAAMNRSAKPVLRVIAPLTGRTSVDGGFCQVLVAGTVPSARTFNCAVNAWPLAREPVVHPRVLVRCTVNVQFPEAWVAVIDPSPPKPINGSVLFSQAERETKRVRHKIAGRT
jgi:hypothetical protein